MVAALWLGLLAATAAPEPPGAVLLLARDGWHRQDEALLQALRIYTRDLDVSLRTDTLPPEASGAEDRARAAEVRCAPDVALVVWFYGDRTAPMLAELVCATRQRRNEPLDPPKDLALATHTLALKIRALLVKVPPERATEAGAQTGDAPGEHRRGPAAPAPATPPGATVGAAPTAGPGPVSAARAPARTPAPAPASAATGPRPAPPAPATPPDARQGLAMLAPDETRRPAIDPPRTEAVVLTTPVAAERPARLELGLAYAFDAPGRAAWVAHGAALRLAFPFARRPLALELDLAATAASPVERADYGLTVRELPAAGVALTARARVWRWLFAAGPRASLRVVSAEGTSRDGRRGSTWGAAAGIGAVAALRLDLWGDLSVALTMSADLIAPRRQLTLDGRAGAELGHLQWGGSAGLTYTVR